MVLNCECSKGDIYIQRMCKDVHEFRIMLAVHEDKIIEEFVFKKYPDVTLTFSCDSIVKAKENNLTLGYIPSVVPDVVVPFTLGAKLYHLLQKQKTVIDYETWKNTSYLIEDCVLCTFKTDLKANEKLPWSFYIKGHQYTCPSFFIPDKRRPHIAKKTGNVQFFFNVSIICDNMYPQLTLFRKNFDLNHLGNMVIFPSVTLFTKLFSNVCRVSKRIVSQRFQKFVNVGSLEKGLSYTGNYTVMSNSIQDRVNEVRSYGFSASSSNYYTEVPQTNDFQAIVSCFDCQKKITKNVTSTEHQKLHTSEKGFIDPMYTSLNLNVGRILSLCCDLKISYEQISSQEIIDFLFGTLKSDKGFLITLIIINNGEYILSEVKNFYLDNSINLLKEKYELIEILLIEKQVLWVTTTPNILYKKALNSSFYYTPYEYSHSKLDPCNIIGLVSLPLPFFRHNNNAKNTFVISNKKLAQFFPPCRINTHSPAKSWSLCYPQLMYKQLESVSYSTVLCIAAIMCVQGKNQEDGIVVNKQSVERGLFSTLKYAKFKITFDTNAVVSLNVKPKEKLVNENTPIAMISNTTFVHTYNIEVVLEEKGTKANRVYYVYVKKIEGIENIILQKDNLTIVSVSSQQLQIGDKIVSLTGQKSVVTDIVSPENLPFFKTKLFEGIPDLFIHTCMIKRQTVAVFLEGINRHIISFEGKNSIKFPFLDNCFSESYNSIQLLELNDELCTCHPMNGETGILMADPVTVLALSYHILPQHGAADKCYVTNEVTKTKKDMLTGQYMRGKPRNGALGFGTMETDVIIGSGITQTLENLIYQRCDDRPLSLNNNTTHIDFGTSTYRYLDDLRLLNIGFNVETRPDLEISSSSLST